MSHTSAASAISAQVAAIHGSASEGARERAITIVDDDVAICVLRGGLADGHPDAATARRQAFDPALEPAMRAAVERTVGRTVATVAVDTHLDPDMTLLTFTFAPVSAARRLEPDVR